MQWWYSSTDDVISNMILVCPKRWVYLQSNQHFLNFKLVVSTRRFWFAPYFQTSDLTQIWHKTNHLFHWRWRSKGSSSGMWQWNIYRNIYEISIAISVYSWGYSSIRYTIWLWRTVRHGYYHGPNRNRSIAPLGPDDPIWKTS